MVCGDTAGDGQAEILTQVARAVVLSSPLPCVLVSAGHRPPRAGGWSLAEVCAVGAHAWEMPRNTACWAGTWMQFTGPAGPNP